MLYLLMTFGRGSNQRALKIGYTDSTKTRKNHYRIHNPFIEWISQRPGDEYLETKIHMYLTSFGLKESFLNEWFNDCQETRQRFHDSIESINNQIWRKRNILFKETDFAKESTKKKIYEELRMIYGDPIKENEVDRWWKIDFNKRTLKSIKNSFYL